MSCVQRTWGSMIGGSEVSALFSVIVPRDFAATRVAKIPTKPPWPLPMLTFWFKVSKLEKLPTKPDAEIYSR